MELFFSEALRLAVWDGRPEAMGAQGIVRGVTKLEGSGLGFKKLDDFKRDL
jgi:hypothetical protein